MSGTVQVTGIGVVAPNGLGVKEYWNATLEGRGGISRLTRFDASGYAASLAGQILDFDPAEHLPNRLLPQTDISTQLALAAADWALTDGLVNPGELVDYDLGVITASGSGGFDFTHREFDNLWSRGREFVSVYESFAWFYAANTGQISIKNGLRGPGAALVAEQAGGLDALGHARRTIGLGTPLVVSGGVDSALDPWGWSAHLSSGRISRGTDPARAYLPFDAAADGHVPAEGGAFLVLEQAPAARTGGAGQVYGEITGYASTFDPPPGSPRPPGLRRAAELALADAGLAPGDIGVVFADAAGSADLDLAEARAISGLFGPHAVPVAAPKALIGRLGAGGGPLDVVTALLTLRDGAIPAVPGGYEVPPEYGIDLVRGAPRSTDADAALVLARGRWGFNSALVVQAVRGG
ncbi:ketosynthase chain-length factor [Streptomyces chrestomyceticus]|uniref:ketosynthase chain-length factor n=1 Tax=Streptomyces chrestomyceticus TaxID=68185 RepID=UPI00379D53EE